MNTLLQWNFCNDFSKPNPASKTLKGLLVIIGLLISGHVFGMLGKYVFNHDYIYGLVPLFDLNRERNVPTTYATLALLLASFLLAQIFLATLAAKQKYYLNWLILAIGFAFMAADEFFGIHEALMASMKTEREYAGALYFAWVIPYAIGVLLVLLSMLKFLFSLPVVIRTYFLLAGALFVGGAIGFELLEGLQITSSGRDFVFDLFCLIEESLEMLGVALFIFALLLYKIEVLPGRAGPEHGATTGNSEI